MISFKRLNYILVYAKHWHAPTAAKELEISNSALNARLNRLEKLLGFNVFVRDNFKQRVALTNKGYKIVNSVSAINKALKQLEELTND